MALIKCPECGKEISDQSDKCIHCGYPLKLKENTICNINGKEYDLSFILKSLKEYPDEKVKLIAIFIKMTNCGLADAKKVIDQIIETGKIPSALFLQQKESQPSQEEENTVHCPKCPNCHSTNIKPISGTKRWLTAGLFGLASSNIGKTMECKNCGYKW